MKVLITGAGGFIGGVATRVFRQLVGWEIIGLDSLVRPGSRPPKGCEFYQADVRAIDDVPLPRVDAVLHLAAQAAVTRSLTSPLHDFGTNAEGTLRVVLWADRIGARVVYASSNKVFGPLDGVREPIGDAQPIAPRTPYGISKATGDLYVCEYGGVSFRQSCIYGETQVGSEDQGWAAYVARRVRAGEAVTCYGDGTQVRDLLHVEDLCAAYGKALIGRIPPGAYTIGGGEANAVSFADFVACVAGTREVTIHQDEWRPADQRYFVAANDGLAPHGWTPRLDWRDTWASATDAR